MICNMKHTFCIITFPFYKFFHYIFILFLFYLFLFLFFQYINHDITNGLKDSRGRNGEPAGFNVGYKQCVNGKGDGLCRGVGDVGMQTQGLGVPVGCFGGETGAVF